MKKLFLILSGFFLIISLIDTQYAEANKKIKVEISFYCPLAGGINCDGTPETTSFMTKPKARRTVAVSQSLLKKGLKKGTRIYIPEVGVRIVEDTMGAGSKGNKLDICVSSKKKAMKLGRWKNVEVIILE